MIDVEREFTSHELNLLRFFAAAVDEHDRQINVAYADVVFSTAVCIKLEAQGVAQIMLRSRANAIGGARRHLQELIRKGVQI